MKTITYNTITEIPKRKYQGYIWFSDKTTPKVLLGKEEFDFSSIDTQNPFIVEALLYCENENKSIMLKHSDKYIIKEFDLNELTKDAEVVEKEYLPHQLKDVAKLKFKQFWETKPFLINGEEKNEDETENEYMETLQLKATVFTGFITNKKSN